MITSQLEERLGSSEEFDEALIAENACPELRELLETHMNGAGLSRAELIRRLNVERTYGYQILNGTRKPTRDHLIRIGLLLRLDAEGMQRLLKVGGKKPLYVRDMFDAKVYFAVKKKMGFEQAAEFIWR